MESPASSLFSSKRFLVELVLTVVVFSLLVKLGFWQLDRGKQKQALEQSILARSDLPYQDMNAVLNNNDWRTESVIGVKVKTQIQPKPLPVVLLDNQTYNSNVGYLAYQVVSISQTQNRLALMELGFIESGRSRTELPVVQVLEEPTLVTGRLYRKSMNPLSSDLMPEVGDVVRVQNINIGELSELLNIELIPAILQPDNLNSWPYEFPWNPLPFTSAKHFGYAFQWFAMAGVFLLLMMAIFIRRLKSAASHGGEV